MVELLIGAGASINWSPPVAVASAPTGPKPKFGTTPLLNAIDMCDQYRGTDQVVGLTVLQALLIAGADLSQGGWRSRGSMYSHIGSLHLVWYTPRSWFELLAGTAGEIGIEAADLIEVTTHALGLFELSHVRVSAQSAPGTLKTHQNPFVTTITAAWFRSCSGATPRTVLLCAS